MNKFTRKFNNTCARFAFWEALTRHCAEFEKLLNPTDFLTHEDRQVLRELHSRIYECFNLVKTQKLSHWEHLKFLRRNYHV